MEGIQFSLCIAPGLRASQLPSKSNTGLDDLRDLRVICLAPSGRDWGREGVCVCVCVGVGGVIVGAGGLAGGTST